MPVPTDGPSPSEDDHTAEHREFRKAAHIVDLLMKDVYRIHCWNLLFHRNYMALKARVRALEKQCKTEAAAPG